MVTRPYGILMSIPCILLVLYITGLAAMKLLPQRALTMCNSLILKKRRQMEESGTNQCRPLLSCIVYLKKVLVVFIVH